MPVIKRDRHEKSLLQQRCESVAYLTDKDFELHIEDEKVHNNIFIFYIIRRPIGLLVRKNVRYVVISDKFYSFAFISILGNVTRMS